MVTEKMIEAASPSTREAIARVIDPHNFMISGSAYGVDDEGFKTTWAYMAQQVALTKADQIIAALSTDAKPVAFLGVNKDDNSKRGLTFDEFELSCWRSGGHEAFPLYAATPALSVAVKDSFDVQNVIKEMIAVATGEYEGHDENLDPWTADNRADIDRWQCVISSALSAQVQDDRSDDDEETYQIGVRDGYSQAVQEIDRLTGGDGEYRYCTDHNPERHTPGPAEMIQRIVDRFETLNLIGDAEKRGDFWDAPGSAQVQDVAGEEFGAPGPDAMRVIDPDQWEPCSPSYLKRGGCCATAPRVWHTTDLNHWHPRLPAAPAAKQEEKP